MIQNHIKLALIAVAAAAVSAAQAPGAKTFRAGAYAIDVTPPKFPVIVNGMFL